jgi:hypothetical protein
MSPGAMASRPNEPHNTTTSIGLWSSNVPFLRIRVAAMQGRQREPLLSFSRRAGRPHGRQTLQPMRWRQDGEDVSKTRPQTARGPSRPFPSRSPSGRHHYTLTPVSLVPSGPRTQRSSATGHSSPRWACCSPGLINQRMRPSSLIQSLSVH